MDFEHIRIGGAPPGQSKSDDGEIVIIAGAPDSESAQAESMEMQMSSECVPASKSAEEPAQESHASARSQKTTEDDYRPTSLEDIRSSKMPKAQIAVIVVAIVCLVAFAVWYIVRP